MTNQRNSANNIPHEKKVEGGKNSHSGSQSNENANNQGGRESNLSQADRAKGGRNSHGGNR